MRTFLELLSEDKGGKNLHLEHLEDEILNYGVDGGRAAINFLQSLRDMLSGAVKVGSGHLMIFVIDLKDGILLNQYSIKQKKSLYNK